MLRWIAAALVVAAAIALAHDPARSMEALALKVIGFSPDGRYFGFVQYGGQGDGGEYLAETYVIDTGRDRFAPGVPVRINTVDEEAIAEEAEDPAKLLALAMKRSQALIKKFDVTRPGAILTRVEAARTDAPHSGSGGPISGEKTVTAKHPVLGDLKLTLGIKQFAWPKTSRHGTHKGAISCAREVDWQKGAGFRLTLEQAGRTIVLNDDKTIPASRHCVTGYGIAEVHAFDRPDGKVTLAVIVGMDVRGFEGNDRLFFAVTRVLGR